MSTSPFIYDVTQLDFEEKVLAASMQVPVLVDFWAPWCGPCKSLTPVLERVVESYDGAVLLAKINTDEEGQLASIFGIKSLPTVMLLKGGRPIDGFMGAQPEGVIREVLAAHLGEPSNEELPADDALEPELTPEERVAQLKAQIAEDPSRDELRLDLADALMQVGAADEVATLLDVLPANLAESDRAKKLRSHLSFARALAGAPPRAELEAAIASDPKNLRARHQLGTRLLLTGEEEAALAQFLEIMRTDRKFDEDLGRKTLIAAFDLVADPELVSATRRKMASLIF